VLNTSQIVVINFDGTNKINWYYNGGWHREKTDEGAIGTNFCNLYIGNNSAQTRSYEGEISFSRIYNKVLSPNQIKRRYEQPDHDYCRGS